MDAKEKVKAAIEELEHLQREYGWLEHDLEDDPEDVEMKVDQLVTEFVMAGYRLWKALGEPEHIRYPAYSEKTRFAHGDQITPGTKTYLSPISEIFDLIVRG